MFYSYALIFTAILWKLVKLASKTYLCWHPTEVKWFPSQKGFSILSVTTANLTCRRLFEFLGRKFLVCVIDNRKMPKNNIMISRKSWFSEVTGKKNYDFFNPSSVHMITNFSSMWTSVSGVRRTQLEEKKEKISLVVLTAVPSKVTADETFSGSR